MRRQLLCTAAALLAWGCGDGSTPPPVATAIAVTPGATTLDAVGATRVVRAAVTDQNEDPMPSATVTWTSSSPAVTVASAGGDSAIVTAAGNGTATITASAGAASGTASVQVAQAAAAVQKSAGDNQTGTVTMALGQPLRVTVRDRLDAPAEGVTVTFTVTQGAGTVSAPSAVTGADGVATVTWTLGAAAGTQRVRAAVAGVANADFTATAQAGPAATAVVVDGGDQTGTPGTAVGVQPAVRVTDASGNPVAGVAVQFTVTAGGGSVTGATRTTDASGIARVGSWTLGAAGANRLTVTFPGTAVPAIVFTATGADIGTVSIVGGNNQGAMTGTAVPVAPSVVVRNGGGSPVAGLTVTFAVVSGGGSVGNATATTNANGVASAGSWTLGAAGPNTLRASVAGLNAAPAEFRGIGCEGGGAGYRMTLCYTTPMTQSQRNVFQTAATRWASVITADLPDVSGSIPANDCGSGSPAISMTVDDLIIFAGIENIDGPGQILGQAGPCYVRDPSYLPSVGVMRFDAADVANLESTNQFASVILHEMGHVVGVGTLWNALGLLRNASTASNSRDTYFAGTNAIAGFDAIGGSTYTGGFKVPVENTGGPGTMNGHWRESLLGRELMTGYLNNGSNPMSALTVRSLIDLGYSVNPATADAFTVTLSLQAEGAPASRIKMHNDIYTGPLYKMDRQGRRTRIRN